MLTLTTNSPEETQAFARYLAENLDPQAIALVGNLGMGKTCFAKGFLAALGVDSEDVASPTFAILHHYDTIPSVLHMDLYRLEIEDLPNLALDEQMDEHIEDEGGFVLVEWANTHPHLLPPNTLWIEFYQGDVGRRLCCRGPERVLSILRGWQP